MYCRVKAAGAAAGVAAAGAGADAGATVGAPAVTIGGAGVTAVVAVTGFGCRFCCYGCCHGRSVRQLLERFVDSVRPGTPQTLH